MHSYSTTNAGLLQGKVLNIRKGFVLSESWAKIKSLHPITPELWADSWGEEMFQKAFWKVNKQ